MYMRNTIFLNSELPSRLRPVLSVKLRQVRGIVSAVVEEKKVTVYYMGRLDLRALHLFVRAFEEKYGRKKEAKNDDMNYFHVGNFGVKFTQKFFQVTDQLV